MSDTMSPVGHYTAFLDHRRIAAGTAREVASVVLERSDAGAEGTILVFCNDSGRRVDLDLRGSPQDVVDRAEAQWPSAADGAAAQATVQRGPGRPKLGVVSKEVTLLPRHWAWLRTQRGGASATLRRLVDEARRRDGGGSRARHAQDATYRFMYAMVGDAPGFEEALRALYAGDAEGFEAESGPWPEDVRRHARAMAAGAFADASGVGPEPAGPRSHGDGAGGALPLNV